MLVGIVSDSHDNVPMLRRAVEHFNAEGCELVIHAGDVVAPFSMAAMDGLNCPFRAVYGNNDGEKVGLKIKAASVGGSIEEPPIQLTASGLAIRVVHDCADWETEAVNNGADVVIFGHTHEMVVETSSGQELPIGSQSRRVRRLAYGELHRGYSGYHHPPGQDYRPDAGTGQGYRRVDIDSARSVTINNTLQPIAQKMV